MPTSMASVSAGRLPLNQKEAKVSFVFVCAVYVYTYGGLYILYIYMYNMHVTMLTLLIYILND